MSRYWCEVSVPAEEYAKVKENLFGFLESENFPATYSEINKAIKDISEVPDNEYSPISIIPIDTISAAIAKHKENPSAKICILNFADYKFPGGTFIVQDIPPAQEEAICYCTNLYQEISKYLTSWYTPHQKALNKGLYANESILSKNISVVASAPGVLFPKEDCFQIDVLTCAAPNLNYLSRNGQRNCTEAVEAQKDRVKYVMELLCGEQYDAVILGAFGCGVFHCNPEIISKAFIEFLKENRNKMKDTVFAIPDENSTNFKIFVKNFSAVF